jgi:hypothetical protein
MPVRSDKPDALKHDYRRGEIIWVLKQDYPHEVTARELQLVLRDRNIPLAARDLAIYLSYLEEAGYVRCKRQYDENSARDLILTAALTAKGMLLFDQKVHDAGVRF